MAVLLRHLCPGRRHIPDLVYQATEDGISVSLFVPSRVTTAIGKHTVVLEQRTAFPESNETVLSLRSDQPVELTLRVRVPSWSRRTVLELNGIAVDHSAGPEQWVAVRRTWIPTDTLTVRFDCTLGATAVDEYHPNRVAMTYGPLVLAQDASWAARSAPLCPGRWSSGRSSSSAKRQPRLCPRCSGTGRMPTGAFRPFTTSPSTCLTAFTTTWTGPGSSERWLTETLTEK